MTKIIPGADRMAAELRRLKALEEEDSRLEQTGCRSLAGQSDRFVADIWVRWCRFFDRFGCLSPARARDEIGIMFLELELPCSFPLIQSQKYLVAF